MDRKITEAELQAIVNYVLSVPTGDKPAGEVMNLVTMLQRLPPAEPQKAGGSQPEG